jgi:Histidine kinase-, DNA gyrase B-, and HSP90-like ATPase
MSVTDNGPGVPAGQRERIFEPFVRLPRSSRSGTGLGLAIVRRTIESHRRDDHLATRPPPAAPDSRCDYRRLRKGEHDRNPGSGFPDAGLPSLFNALPTRAGDPEPIEGSGRHDYEPRQHQGRGQLVSTDALNPTTLYVANAAA